MVKTKTGPVIVVKKKKFVARTLTPPHTATPKPLAKLQPTLAEKAAKQAAHLERTRIEQQAAAHRRLDIKRAHRMENRAILATMGATWPALFDRDAPTVPLKKQIHVDIIAALPEYSKQRIRGALSHYFHLVKVPYLAALAAGGQRVDLNGQACGTITAEEQEQARVELAALTEVPHDVG